MKNKYIFLVVAVSIVTASFLLFSKYGGMGTSEKNNRGVLAQPRPRHLKEPDHRNKLVTDPKGNLVGLSVFEANLKLDESYVKDGKDYRDKLLINYVELGLRANPEQTLRFLRESRTEWADNVHTASPIIRAIASHLGLESIREFLDMVSTRNVVANIVTGISLDLKEGGSNAMADFFLSYDSTLLADEGVMGNLMKAGWADLGKLTELYSKLPQCPERVAAAVVLAQKSSTLCIEEFRDFYRSISGQLSLDETRAMHSKLTENMNSLDDPKLALLLANGYQGDDERLLSLAANSADLNLEDALNSVRSLDVTQELRNTLFSGIMRSWAQYAPKKAAQYAYSSYQSGETNHQAMNVVYGEWISRDTPAAVSYFSRLDLDMQTKRMADLSHFPNVASYSIADGLALLQERQNDQSYPPELVDNMRYDFALSDGAHHSSQVVLGELGKIQDPTIRDSAYFRFSSALASENLFKAVSLAAQTTIPSQRDQMLIGALGAAISYDINYAHDMIPHINDTHKREVAYMQWFDATRNKEPHIAADWLRDLEKNNHQLYEKLYK